MSMSESLEQLSKSLGTDWKHIRRASEASSAIRRSLESELKAFTSEDSSFVVLGSLARNEFTSGSDLDWMLLVDGFASSAHMDHALAIERHLADKGLKGPGAERTFGAPVFSHDLVHYIGGEDDTNANLTRRLLLLLESSAVGRGEAYSRTIRNVLTRYVVEDFGWMNARNPSNVPRFLHNDVARFWRTMAVDFAYKRKKRVGKGWALRTAKLRLSRKLIYGAGLLMCFSPASVPELRDIPREEDRRTAAYKVIEHLAAFVGRPPLWTFADFFIQDDSRMGTAKKFFDVYDGFLALLADNNKRERLENLQHDEIATDPIYETARELGHDFQDCLNEIFFEPGPRGLYELTKTYGVF